MLRRLLIAGALSTAALALTGLPQCTRAGEPQATPRQRRGGTEILRVKGLRPHLVIRRKHGALVERLASDAMAHRGDVLQISYVAAGHHHGVVLSLDGIGRVTLHHPQSHFGLPASTRLHGRGEHPLPSAFELDDAPRFERFILVTSGDRPTDIDVVVDAARRRASDPDAARDLPLDLPPHLSQASLILRKEP